MQQPGLGFDTPARTAVRNVFFALWPDEGVRVQIEERAKALDNRNHPRGRLLKPARYHLTLQFLGEYAEVPPQLIEDVAKAAARIQVPVFDLLLEASTTPRQPPTETRHAAARSTHRRLHRPPGRLRTPHPRICAHGGA